MSATTIACSSANKERITPQPSRPRSLMKTPPNFIQRGLTAALLLFALTLGTNALAQGTFRSPNATADTSFETGPGWQISLNSGGSYGPPDAFSSRTLPDGDVVTGIAGGNPFNLSDRWYRYTFTLTELTMSARAFFVTDNLFDLLVNGNSVDISMIVDGDPGPAIKHQSPPGGLTIPASFFQLGSNEILFKTHVNTGGQAGDPFLAARVDLSSVPEPSTWAIMIFGGSGLLGLQRLRRRRSSR